MAGLRNKPTRRKDNTNPNVVIIVFLVFFVLLSIGLGVGVYYAMDDADKAKLEANKANAAATVIKKDMDEWKFKTYDLTQAVTGEIAGDKEKDEYAVLLKEFEEDKLGAGTKAQREILKPLLGYKDKQYEKTVAAAIEEAHKERDEAKAQLKKVQEEHDRAVAQFNSLRTLQDTANKTALAAIDAGNSKILQEARERHKAVEAIVAESRARDEKITEMNQEFEKERNNLERTIREWKAKYDEKDKQERVQFITPTRTTVDNYGLLVDVSTGKPLWDQPLGKLIRVDMGKRQVIINLGSAAGVQPEQTFTVFAQGPYKRAVGFMKGVIEVIGVIDAQTSVARINALYDGEGHEILLFDDTTANKQREAENALQEGDQIYNMFWGAHVALAGSMTLDGRTTDSPAEQKRQLDDFIRFVQRQGMVLDAYVDMTDAQIKGSIGPKTRYLIRGADLQLPDNVRKEDPAGERVKAVNDAAQAMRKEAADKGLFIISADNYLAVVGYRAPRPGVEAARFRPLAPRAGSPLPVQIIRPAAGEGEKAPENQ